MTLYIAMGLAFFSAAALLYVSLTAFYPPIREYIQADYLEVDLTL